MITDNENYQTIATKVSANGLAALKLLARRNGCTLYELLQMVCDVLIRYMDDRHNMTPEMDSLLKVFENMEGWGHAFNLADPSARPEVGEATYYLNDKDGSKQGVRAVLVTKPFFGQGQYTYNVQTIVERTFCLLFPQKYKSLRVLGQALGSNTVLETLDKLTQEHEEHEAFAELTRQFEDNDRGEFGTKPHEGEPYKRKMNRQQNETE